MSDYDLVVLGGGAAGLGAARVGRWERARVALISDSPLGGDCTFTGCVPSKSLIEASRQGLSFARALERVVSVVSHIASMESADVLRAEGVDVIESRATFVGPRVLDAGGRVLDARRVIIATGSRPTVPPIAGLAESPFLTNETFFRPRPQPGSLVIIGGGPIGCELGEAMARFGTAVTIIESVQRILGQYEPDAAALVETALRSSGIDLRTGTTITGVTFDAELNRFAVRLDGDTVIADELLVATGRTPNTVGIGLDAAGIALDARGFIVTNRYLQTTAKGVYAAGDCNGVQLLSHAADEMGRVAAWSALRPGRRYRYDPLRIPHVVFTTPEVASIGVLEVAAPPNARIAEMAMSANDRALAADQAEGFVRLIARPALLSRNVAGGKLIGATIVGGRAGELINEAALLMRSNGYAGRLAQTVHAYPSWGSILQKTAARWFFDYDGSGARPPRRAG